MTCSCSCGSSMICASTTTRASTLPCLANKALCPCSVLTLGINICCVPLMALKVRCEAVANDALQGAAVSCSRTASRTGSQQATATAMQLSKPRNQCVLPTCIQQVLECISTLSRPPRRCWTGQQQLPEPACTPQPGTPEQALWCLDNVLPFPPMSSAHSCIGAAAALLHRSSLLGNLSQHLPGASWRQKV